ncbi:MAG: glycosyltransferase family 4 protein [Methyloprofundus sp.]|nr:glycosyltransferase family 4 protein [Methyloprofundus sp.]
MKILIVNTSDIQGGAARAAYRLHQALLAEGVDSQMLVQSKSSDDYTVIGPHTKFQKAMGKMRPTLDSIPVRRYPARTKTLFSPSWVPFAGLVDKINAINPDVVHLHWIAGGMMRIEDLAKIKAPIVWSLHDNWGFTGGCHIMWECERYKQTCGACPRLASKKENDLSRKVWLRKQNIFSKLADMKIIGLSSWLADCAKQSSLFKNHEVVCLPNLINTETYSPFNKSQARVLLNLPQGKKLIAFGAMSATSDINKGFKELAQALDHLPADYELVVFGSSAPQTPQGFKQKAHYLGHLHDDVSLRVLYSAANVMVVPSLQENLSNAIMESLACGTPVVGFDIGGNSDLVDHQINGYLARPFDTNDLANGIDWVLSAINYNQLCENAREKVVSTFDSRLVVNQYIELYQHIINTQK